LLHIARGDDLHTRIDQHVTIDVDHHRVGNTVGKAITIAIYRLDLHRLKQGNQLRVTRIVIQPVDPPVRVGIAAHRIEHRHEADEEVDRVFVDQAVTIVVEPIDRVFIDQRIAVVVQLRVGDGDTDILDLEPVEQPVVIGIMIKRVGRVERWLDRIFIDQTVTVIVDTVDRVLVV
jgi:hypothetical protein